ncbi:DUF393 domain-containing protein [Pedobacter chinensis]|uniref:DUF393 domain-containing protein n=1 Tax=Pedobacter chinensis TaxID=2282421 RepID=A0A369Q0S2_9SPHI|nr:DUF393 domain-containing protein [Pedobacter chinensis]RDC57065.1 DUF393 domain-containing protein [Pedobacter chinensis]
MRTLKNHVILFDDECPMCYVYTKAFVKTGMLPANGRESYQNMPQNICLLVDHQRAANEIALVNTENGEVTYGIQSLFKIIGNSIPLFKPLFEFKPLVYLMGHVYAFISYNRKVIIPATAKSGTFQPDFKIQYRIAYLLFSWLVTAYILTTYAHLLIDFVPPGGKYREYFICGGQMFFQGIIIFFYKREKLWEYLGNMMTISLAGALLLLPVMAISGYFEINSIFFILYFLLVAGLMFLEHIRRSRILKLSWTMSITWLLYRLIILGLIFII